ncbi:uncharacterized protein PAC_01433 [Phialocephala subalpina]|uniref:Acyltransferase 3 domain-containing protein n=1 Tax=Phialocephala subalpina TaxID=576137 RepID=A0A1L7WFK4_9HELO|nr:uncharacterized protein PAC_01433 [Phialocephala subalpina]
MPSIEDEEQNALLLEDFDQVKDSPSSLSHPERSDDFIRGPSIDDAILGKSSGLLSKSWHFTWRSIIPALAPSFLPLGQDHEPQKKRKLHPTSYLDGLRGVAAFFVYVHHFILVWFPTLSHGYNSIPGTTSIFQAPIIRIIYAGRGMVTIFFVFSGYVLSYKALRQIRKGDYEGLLNTLASATFRRMLRLFLPIAASTFLCMLFARWGWYVGAPTNPGITPTFFAQVRDWWLHLVAISNPTEGINGESIYADPYGFQLWTIPREFRGSLVIYLSLLGLAKTAQLQRAILEAGLVAYTFWVGQWDLGLFLSGLMLAEMQFIREDLACAPLFTNLGRFVPSAVQRNKNTLLHALTFVMVVVAIHFLTFPDLSASSTPGYSHMISWTPPLYGSVNLTQRFWLCLGSIILVLALCLSPPIQHGSTPLLQKVFNHPFSQYLANISYALYVTHALVLWSVGGRLLSHWNVARVTSGQYIIGFLISAVINSILCFWMSDLFWRGVDAKSVEFAKWVTDWCFIE